MSFLEARARKKSNVGVIRPERSEMTTSNEYVLESLNFHRKFTGRTPHQIQQLTQFMFAALSSHLPSTECRSVGRLRSLSFDTIYRSIQLDIQILT